MLRHERGVSVAENQNVVLDPSQETEKVAETGNEPEVDEVVAMKVLPPQLDLPEYRDLAMSIQRLALVFPTATL